jgi:hypothetical protein
VVHVTLTDEELKDVREVVAQMLAEVRDKGLRDPFGQWGPAPAERALGGHAAELAVAKWAGLPWRGRELGRFREADVGRSIGVRFRPDPGKGDLSVRPSDNSRHAAVLVHPSHAPGGFRLVGWQMVASCQVPKYLRVCSGGRVLYFVPPGELRSMESLAQLIAEHKRRVA